MKNKASHWAGCIDAICEAFKMDAAPKFARNELQGINEGDPVDIPRDQYISVRVQMPQDSIWNQRKAMAEVPDSFAD